MPSNETFTLPVGPDELCFDKNEFIKKTFSVDEFLHEHRNAAGLEEMRDDLGLYLKVLRSAMIELINEDYVDFVNLSSNLIGLDQSINGIQSALGQLKEEVLMVKMNLTDTMTDLSNCLEEKKLLKEYLRSVHSVTKAQQSIEKLEALLGNKLDESIDTNPVILERASLELIQLEFDMQFCTKLLDSKFGKDKLGSLNQLLMAKLNQYFLNSLSKTTTCETLDRCLRMYGTLDETNAAETIIRKQIVAPRIQIIISESALQNCPQGLAGIYKQILNVLDTDLKKLIELTKTDRRFKGFDFVTNSFWVEVERCLEMHMSSIFAPGNPDLFYQKYKSTLEFLRELEDAIGSKERVELWHKHAQYKSFQARWNLPVYFQIRFQEIGGALEKACSTSDAKSTKAVIQKASDFQLTPFSVAWSCLLKCWSSGVYLQEIFVRFWMLSLRIIARIAKWIDECSESKGDTKDKPNDGTNLVFFVSMYLDTVTLNGKLDDLLVNILEKVPSNVVGHEEILETCFGESKGLLNQKLVVLEERIGREILEESSGYIRQVNDIPRVYRKTNKDIPSKPCAYVDQTLIPISRFCEKYSQRLDRTILIRFLEKVFSALNTQYYSVVSDVLTSVQKTEESLRRLKNLRDKSTLMSSSSSDKLGMSDDDKIRLQLQVDVLYWTAEIKKIGIEVNKVEKLKELISLLEDATKIRINEKD